MYTGITTDIKRRLKEHNDGKGSKSVLGKRPVEVVYKEKADNQVAAAKREREIKGWGRKKKLLLVNK
jgi:putative endonuclease